MWTRRKRNHKEIQTNIVSHTFSGKAKKNPKYTSYESTLDLKIYKPNEIEKFLIGISGSEKFDLDQIDLAQVRSLVKESIYHN
jgi:hypothetical protein